MTQKGQYYNKLTDVHNVRQYYIISPITKSTEPLTNKERREQWELFIKAQNHLLFRVLNRRLPCINYTE